MTPLPLSKEKRVEPGRRGTESKSTRILLARCQAKSSTSEAASRIQTQNGQRFYFVVGYFV